MADVHVQIQVGDFKAQLENNTTPLLNNQEPPPPTTTTQEESNKEEGDRETNLDKTLQRLDLYLSLLGYKQSSLPTILISWSLFSLIGVVLPVGLLELFNCPGCVKGQIQSFELGIVVSQASLAAASLLCLSHNLRKYGIRKFLFVDRYSGHVERFSDQYVRKISESKRLLLLWIVPCCLLKTAREIVRLMYVPHGSRLQSMFILIAFVFSWAYVTTIFLSGCILFHLVCGLQVIHFDDYGKLLEREPDVLVLLQEHARLRYYLSKISHRFRIYLILQYAIVTVCQFTTLFRTTEYNGMVTFINGGDFAVSSIVQVVGIILCLNAAAKISHRAQGIGALANKWHALMTCSASDSSRFLRTANSFGSFDASDNPGSINADYSESDLESLDFTTAPSNSQLASYMSSYHKRLALVMYLQSNPGGITIFGWTVDRGLINTIFFIELSLVTFVLGKTIVVTSE